MNEIRETIAGESVTDSSSSKVDKDALLKEMGLLHDSVSSQVSKQQELLTSVPVCSLF